MNTVFMSIGKIKIMKKVMARKMRTMLMIVTCFKEEISKPYILVYWFTLIIEGCLQKTIIKYYGL